MVCKKGSYAFKEWLLQSTLLQIELNRSKIEYVEMYIDFKKVYDTINHKLLILYLNYFRLYLHIIENITYMTTKWKITLIYEFGNFWNIKISNLIIQWDIL